jgi:hypothetical protein
LPRHLFAAAWVALALSYSPSGYTKLLSPAWVDGETIRLVLENPLARDHALRSAVLALGRCCFSMASARFVTPP